MHNKKCKAHQNTICTTHQCNAQLKCKENKCNVQLTNAMHNWVEIPLSPIQCTTNWFNAQLSMFCLTPDEINLCGPVQKSVKSRALFALSNYALELTVLALVLTGIGTGLPGPSVLCICVFVYLRICMCAPLSVSLSQRRNAGSSPWLPFSQQPPIAVSSLQHNNMTTLQHNNMTTHDMPNASLPSSPPSYLLQKFVQCVFLPFDSPPS